MPLAVRHRDDVVHERFQDLVLKPGDVILAEVRSHYVQTLKELERQPDSPFAILTEQEGMAAFDKKRFAVVAAVIAAVVVLSSLDILPVMVGTLVGTIIIVLTGGMNMKEVYDAIEWKVVFLMAGAFSLGAGMHNSGLDVKLAGGLATSLGEWGGPVMVISGLYLFTSIITELMSNTATAAMVTPIAISMAHQMDASPKPFIMAVCFAASASFMTPIGYQTNAMVYTAGQYKYTDFLRVGFPLHLLFWALATWLIPYFYPF